MPGAFRTTIGISRTILLGVAVLAALSPLSVAGAADGGKTPPSCSALSFRPVPPGAVDGTQNAGLYRSRFGTIVLRAEVVAGQATTYFVEINGKRPDPLKGALPASVNGCLNSKHVKTPVPSVGAKCVGDRFRVVVDHGARQSYVMLFALGGDVWKLCGASAL
ncbi:MAG: hypothetical protein F8N37_01680 [Telmatospirillum sp.]|nr:hypothetical protein [Telmatospirillum sp.]